MSEERIENLENRQQKEQQSRQQVFMILFFVGIIITVGLAAFFLLNQEEALPELATDFDFEIVPDNSIAYEMVGRDHIDSSAPHDYNSNPPTSGDHNERWISPLGVYGQLEDDRLVHNLEHGHVWLSYRDADDKQALALLTDIQEKYPDRTIVTYRPENDKRIAISAWTRLLVLDELDRAQIEVFIIRHGDNAPESILER